MKGSGNLDIIHYKEIESTSKAAKEMVKSGHSGCFCVAADIQTGGYGQFGRSFWSPAGGLYMSLVLTGDKFKHDGDTVYVAKCVISVLQKYVGEKIEMRGINDAYINGRKVAGVLVEKLGGGEFVIGVGINLAQTKEVPQEIRNKVGFLNIQIDKMELAKEIIDVII